ncbi:bifunctional 2-polyprenyl-6-hydroxyphenol methylase/3-demethylubiquinol 3-O-methyltransferase UbiG [Lacinutrix sp. 5H-3-7-4]|uniref:class I SAM-dependent methyltransferase n=1 Tax=Lacinutrix sp. (strain 5H-3-7-4) TaxID=983544 RepID=UPI00020A3C3D|nr:class I SAM-dependent methyltransferase [Lacinutrix sp. 5H-3-7-4]AEH01630.1 Methyltransferase type 11 [Lacinutrix sp. 5H-3-7-4]
MEKDFEKKYHKYETNHFWFKARRHYIASYLKNKSKDLHILDIGCSSGILLENLYRKGFKKNNLYGVDISAEAIKNCKTNGLKNAFIMDAEKISLDKKFDIIIASDSLEHLKNDEQALKNWLGLLKDDGELLIFVPAFNFLWSNHDDVNMHYRRYTRKQLILKVKNNGFQIKTSGYWNILLFIPVLIYRLISNLLNIVFNKKEKQSDINKITFFNGLLFNILKTENKLLKYITFPFGVSTYCIVKKGNHN